MISTVLIASTERELQARRKDGVTENDLAALKENVVGDYQVRLDSTIGLASAFPRAVKRGIGVD